MVSQKVSDLVITRVFDAPVELVWKAWTDPEQLVRWWGPKNFASPVCKIDFRVGGKYLFCMRDPDGKDYWSTGVFREIIPLKKFVYTDSFADAEGNIVPPSAYGMDGEIPDMFINTITFEDIDGKTRMTTISSGFPEGEDRELASQGWNESLDKLAASLREKGG